MKIATSSKFFLPLLAYLLFVTACKKDLSVKLDPKLALIGSWTETPLTANQSRSIYFGKDNSFTMHYLTFASPNNYASTYQIDGDKLTVILREISTQEGGKAPVVIKDNSQVFEKASYMINANVLSINFVTYPADGPVPTQVKFLKN